MKADVKHIRVGQGISTKVYRYYSDNHCVRVEVRHHEIKPIIFRTTKNVDGRLVHCYVIR